MIGLPLKINFSIDNKQQWIVSATKVVYQLINKLLGYQHYVNNYELILNLIIWE